MNTIISPKLTAAINAARSAVLSSALDGSVSHTETPADLPLDSLPLETQQVISQVCQQAQQPQQPQTVTIDRLSRYATADAIAALSRLSKGARKLWELLHGVAVRVAAQKAYSPAVSQVTFSLPQSLIAAALGYTDRHIRNLQTELHTAGLVDSGALAAKVSGQNLWASTLWAVKTSTAATQPKIRPEDWGHEWRNLELDYKRKNTALGFISGLDKDLKGRLGADLLAAISVTGLFKLHNSVTYRAEIKLGSVQDAIYSLSMLADPETPAERRNLIQQLAGWVSESLHDTHSFRWWCGQLWQLRTWADIGEMQAKLSRLLADLAETATVRNPAALLNSRMV
ncbi:hypothetical protein [Deinococcus sp. Marseille-Q6407]|uniref:hypothetical protein n=1 Tax=Deinococcus sp. Marseille-Q6407 TaxID=2969223 RepID=UPI0021BF4662|nr:hypothetical protein [Deinococcus sp. Marseille-Q6407]